MKKLAIIGASYLQLPLVKKAKELGLEVLCFAWKEGTVCTSICDRFYPISVTEKEEILRICKKEDIDGICTIASDVAAPTVAYVAENMGLVGNSYETAVKANNKYLMREAFIKSDVPCPHFQMVTSHDEIDDSKLEYPLIVKPSDRSGSLGVKKVNNRNELVSAIDTALELSFKNQAMVEEYIEGREISVEFISYNGIHYPLTITDKVTTGAPHFVELEHHQPALFPPQKYEEIYQLTRRALNALGVTNGASHTEYKIEPDGKIYIMEVGARMGGDFIGSDLVKLSTGYDFLKGVIDVALGVFHTPQITSHNYSGVYFLCEETKKILPVFEKWNNYSEIVEAEITNNKLYSVKCSADRSGYIIYKSKTPFHLL